MIFLTIGELRLDTLLAYGIFVVGSDLTLAGIPTFQRPESFLAEREICGFEGEADRTR